MQSSLWAFFLHSPLRIRARLAFLAGVGVLVILATIWIVAGILSARRIVAAGETPALKRELNAIAYPYEIKDISVAFSSADYTRTGYAQFSLELDCPNDVSRRTMELNRAKLIDAVFEVASGFHLEDLRSAKGLARFKSELNRKYHTEFPLLAPREVSLNDWVLQ